MTFPDKWLEFAPAPEPLSSGQKWNVFLSYRSVDRSWVLNLYDVLRGHGHAVFLDQCALTAGDPLVRELEDALLASQAAVLVWSQSTGDSDWVRREYEFLERRATDSSFHFVPVKLDAAELRPFAGGRVWLDFSTYPDGPNGGELLRLLHAVVGRPLSEAAARFADEQNRLAAGELAKIDAAVMNRRPQRVLELFEAGGLPWQTSAALGCKAAQGLISLGCSGDAIEVLETLEEQFPRAIRPRQLRALALARRGDGDRGDLAEAQQILGELYASGERDPETLGIYGRTWMDRYADSGELIDLKQSRDLYAEAFEGATDDYYTGINAAAKSVLLGDARSLASAADLAERVQRIVGTAPHPGDYWMTATVGEVLLIQRNYPEAARLYDAAVSMARSRTDDHRSTWTQACRLMEKLHPSAAERAMIRAAFEHLPDRDG